MFVGKDNKSELLLMFSLRGKDWCQLLLFSLSDAESETMLTATGSLTLELSVLLLAADRIQKIAASEEKKGEKKERTKKACFPNKS